jgi:hypothetical protein
MKLIEYDSVYYNANIYTYCYWLFFELIMIFENIWYIKKDGLITNYNQAGLDIV